MEFIWLTFSHAAVSLKTSLSVAFGKTGERILPPHDRNGAQNRRTCPPPWSIPLYTASSTWCYPRISTSFLCCKTESLPRRMYHFKGHIFSNQFRYTSKGVGWGSPRVYIQRGSWGFGTKNQTTLPTKHQDRSSCIIHGNSLQNNEPCVYFECDACVK